MSSALFATEGCGCSSSFPSSHAQVISSHSYFGIYDTLKPLLLKGGLHNNVLASFGIAYIATTAGAVLAYPLDTIKRRM